jgi:hypothetical protein
MDFTDTKAKFAKELLLQKKENLSIFGGLYGQFKLETEKRQ